MEFSQRSSGLQVRHEAVSDLRGRTISLIFAPCIMLERATTAPPAGASHHIHEPPCSRSANEVRSNRLIDQRQSRDRNA